MRETLGVLLGFFLAAVLGYLISEIAQKEQEKEVLESYMDSLQAVSYTHLTLPTTPYV